MKLKCWLCKDDDGWVKLFFSDKKPSKIEGSWIVENSWSLPQKPTSSLLHKGDYIFETLKKFGYEIKNSDDIYEINLYFDENECPSVQKEISNKF